MTRLLPALLLILVQFPLEAAPPALVTAAHQAADAALTAGTPAVQIAVSHGGQIVYSEAFGIADKEAATAATARTVMQIGSVTKQFTAAAILRLAEQGALSLDDRIEKFVPDFDPRGRTITLRHLLQHTSGLRRDWADAPGSAVDPRYPVTHEQVMKGINGQPFDFLPGKGWSYSNAGYMLLGYTIESVTGRSYADFIHDEFAVRLGLIDTGVCGTSNLPLPGGYGFFTTSTGPNWARLPPWHPTYALSGGAVCSTAVDLSRWSHLLANGGVMLPSSYANMTTPVPPQLFPAVPYAMGLVIEKVLGRPAVWHNGAVEGFYSYLVYFSDQDVAVAVLTNAYPGVPAGDPEFIGLTVAKAALDPCNSAPGNVSVSYEGTESSCGPGGAACQAGEALRFNATFTNYTFSVCDRFVWTFGDDGSTETTYEPSVIHSFSGKGPRTVDLRVENQFGSATATRVTLGTPVAIPCIGSSNPGGALCLGSGLGEPAGSEGRFRITLAARDNPVRSSATGDGQPIPQVSAGKLFGYFSIPQLTQNAANPEVFVKLLDGRGITGSFWFFWGSLTDFDYTITALDTVTGQKETYNRPAGAAYGGFDTSMFKATSYTQPAEGCPIDRTLSAVAPSTCVAGSGNLCLNGNRFKVSVVERHCPSNTNCNADANLVPGAGQAIPRTTEFGLFSFPVATSNPDNAEVFVKILDGRAINGKFWVFYGGLTSLKYDVTVTDTQTGTTNVYHKATNSACGGSDTSAF